MKIIHVFHLKIVQLIFVRKFYTKKVSRIFIHLIVQFCLFFICVSASFSSKFGRCQLNDSLPGSKYDKPTTNRRASLHGGSDTKKICFDADPKKYGGNINNRYGTEKQVCT